MSARTERPRGETVVGQRWCPRDTFLIRYESRSIIDYVIIKVNNWLCYFTKSLGCDSSYSSFEISAKVLISWSWWMMVDWQGGDERSGDESSLTIKHNTVPCHFSSGAIRIYNLWTICWNLGSHLPRIHEKLIRYTIYLSASTEGWQLVGEFAASWGVYVGALVGRQQHQWV